MAGDPDLKPVEKESEKARKALDHSKGEIDSILATFLNKHSDELVRELREHAQKARAMTQQQAQQAYLGGGASQVITRDMQAIGEGWVLAPHLVVQARVIGLRLGQIRFPKANIRAAFEEVRQVLEREGVVGPEGG